MLKHVHNTVGRQPLAPQIIPCVLPHPNLVTTLLFPGHNNITVWPIVFPLEPDRTAPILLECFIPKQLEQFSGAPAIHYECITLSPLPKTLSAYSFYIPPLVSHSSINNVPGPQLQGSQPNSRVMSFAPDLTCRFHTSHESPDYP